MYIYIYIYNDCSCGYRHFLNYAAVSFHKVSYKLDFAEAGIECTRTSTLYVQGSPVEIQTPTLRTWLVAACLPHHLCCHPASTTIISFCLHSHKEKLGTHYKNFISCFFSNISLKLHNLSLHKSGIVCLHNNRYWIWGSYAQHSVTSWCKIWNLLHPGCEECYWPSGLCRNVWLLKMCKALRWVSKLHSTELL
jgi:hypothetical protein